MGTFGVMYLLGYTLDNLSLMALTISTGFVVDDAIVVIENIMRHIEDGKEPFEAAMIGSREIGFTVMSMSISLIAVFIPILMMPGIIGRLFREFAVTLSVAIAVSLVVSLTTTPMLAGRFLKSHKDSKKGWFYLTGEKHLARLTHEYERGLEWVLRHRFLTGIVFLLTFGLNIYLFFIVPKGFFPEQDSGRLQGQLKSQQGHQLRHHEDDPRIHPQDRRERSCRRKHARLHRQRWPRRQRLQHRQRLHGAERLQHPQQNRRHRR